MADLVVIATGNLTTAATWGTNNATGTLVSTNTGVTALTTGTLDSATFTPGAINIHGFALRLGARAAGSPTNKVTVVLRNSTDATNVATIVVNVSDLPVCASGATNNGGWHFFRINGGLTLTAAKAYLIRLSLDSTSTAVSFCTNGTANNWQRILVTQTTAAPAAGDDMHVCQEYNNSSNPATVTARTVTNDKTTNTDFGSAQTNQYVAALDISKGGTLAYGVAASTNYLTRLSGHCKVYSGGTLKIGASGAEIPRTSTAVLEFDCAADGDFFLWNLDLCTTRVAGLSRTSGKNVSYTSLTANQAAAATTCTVADDTGWLNTDEVGIAPTGTTTTQGEVYTLSADATATTLTHAATAAVNAHLGETATKKQAEIVLLTRNVEIRSVSTTFMTAVVIEPNGDFEGSWFRIRYGGGSAGSQPGNFAALECGVTTGRCVLSHVILRDSDRQAYRIGGAMTTGTVTMDNCHVYRCGVTFADHGMFVTSSYVSFAGTLSLTNCVWITMCAAITFELNWTSVSYLVSPATRITFTNLHIIGGNEGFRDTNTTDWGGATIGPLYIHSNSSTGLNFGNANDSANLVVNGAYVWRNGGTGIQLGGRYYNLTFTGPVRISGNGSINLGLASTGTSKVRFTDLGVYGDTSFATGIGIAINGQTMDCEIDVLDAGTASGTLTTHTTGDISTTGSNAKMVQLHVRKATLSSTSKLVSLQHPNTQVGSVIALQRFNATTTHTVRGGVGQIDIETSTVDVTPGMKITPSVTAGLVAKYDSAAGEPGRGYRVPVANGAAVTVSVSVRKDGTYAGAAPRLILRANAAVGILVDAVIDTLSVGANTWEVLTGTTAAVDADGVLEFVVDCDGAAGSIYVDSWSQTGGATTMTSMQYWGDGRPVDCLPAGSPGLQERSYPFVG